MTKKWLGFVACDKRVTKLSLVTAMLTPLKVSTKKWEHYKSDKDFSRIRSLHHFTICHIWVVIQFSYVTLLCHPCRWVIIGAQMWTRDKSPDHVGSVPQQSMDKIGDLYIDNHRFCLRVCTKPNRKLKENFLECAVQKLRGKWKNYVKKLKILREIVENFEANLNKIRRILKKLQRVHIC